MGKLGLEATIDASTIGPLRESLRPILSTLARVMISDRRAVALFSPNADLLLANQSAKRIGLSRERLTADLDWPVLREKARRASRARVEWQAEGQSFEGELIHLPMEPIDIFYLRLSEADHEAIWLKNRARAANLMRVAHDLRTPIQSLLASAQGILDQEDHAGPKVNRAELRRAAEISLDQINAVLATIRGETPVKGVQPDEVIDIAGEVRNLVAMLSPIAASRSSVIVPQFDLPEGLHLRGPLRHLRALFQNLLGNSVNHGGGKVQLRLKCAPLAKDLGAAEGEALWAVEFDLCDEGGGLPQAQRARLMAALSGQDNSPAAGQKRQSAGLEVLSHALDQLGGKLEVFDLGPNGEILSPEAKSRVIGTQFRARFSLPEAPAAAPSALAQVLENERIDGDGLLAGQGVLLVEDSPSARDWLRHVLRRSGAEVVTAGSGPEALSLLSRPEVSSEITLVLSDVTLPFMSGIELAARIRKGDPAAALDWKGPIIGLTAHADDRIRAAGLSAGMDLVLEKPIQPRALVGHLQEILRGETPAAAPAIRLEGEVIDQSVHETLVEQMGAKATRNFMVRALEEAELVMAELTKEGIVADTGRRLHAATGASGLTGLRMVETALRQVEKAAELGPESLAAPLDQLREALRQTRKFVETLAS